MGPVSRSLLSADASDFPNCMPRHWKAVVTIIGVVLAGTGVLAAAGWGGEPSRAQDGQMWEQMVAGAAKLRLPIGFLKSMPSDFVRFEFDDLRKIGRAHV